MMLLPHPLLLGLLLLPILTIPMDAMAQGWLAPTDGQQPGLLEASDVFGVEAALLAGMQVVRPDVTANDPADRALMKAWQVVGPPTTQLIGPDGREHRAERTVGEITPQAFLARLQRIRKGNS